MRTFLAYIGSMFLALAAQATAASSDPVLSVAVSATTVSVGDQLQVEFTLNGSGKGFQAPAFSDFNILMGPSQSTSMQIINGSVSQTLSFTYILQPVREGTFRIGSASIEANGKRVASNPVTVTVVKGNPPPAGQGQRGTQPDNRSGSPDMSKNVFLRATIDKSSVYRGEGIVCTFRLYTRVNLVNYSVSKLPAFNGFWNQEIELPQQLDFRNETLDGVTYRVADIKKVVLFPQRSGALQVEPMEAEVIARIQVRRGRSNDPFDQFFNDPFFNNPFFGGGAQDVRVPLRTEPLTVNVRELPSAPAAFSGAVGKFTMEVSADKKEVKAHDPVTVRIRMSGRGNLKLLDAPALHVPPDFELYDPKITSNITAGAGGVTGSKTFEYLVIPRNEGTFRINIDPFVYFNLDSKTYQTVPGPELSLKVLKGEGGGAAVSTIAGYNKEDIQLLGKDIRFIKTTQSSDEWSGHILFPRSSFWALLAAPAALFILLIFFRKKQEKDRSNIRLLRSRKAGRMAKKRLRLAKKHLDGGKKNEFLDELSKALWGYIGDRLEIPVAELSSETVQHHLAGRQAGEAAIRDFLSVLEACELARFAPEDVTGRPGDIYDKGLRVLTDLEEQLKS